MQQLAHERATGRADARDSRCAGCAARGYFSDDDRADRLVPGWGPRGFTMPEGGAQPRSGRGPRLGHAATRWRCSISLASSKRSTPPHAWSTFVCRAHPRRPADSRHPRLVARRDARRPRSRRACSRRISVCPCTGTAGRRVLEKLREVLRQPPTASSLPDDTAAAAGSDQPGGHGAVSRPNHHPPLMDEFGHGPDHGVDGARHSQVPKATITPTASSTPPTICLPR